MGPRSRRTTEMVLPTIGGTLRALSTTDGTLRALSTTDGALRAPVETAGRPSGAGPGAGGAARRAAGAGPGSAGAARRLTRAARRHAGADRTPGPPAERAEGARAPESRAVTSRCTCRCDGRIPCSLPEPPGRLCRRPQVICLATAWHAFRPGAAIPGGKQKAGLPVHICTCIRTGSCTCGPVPVHAQVLLSASRRTRARRRPSPVRPPHHWSRPAPRRPTRSR